ncbi:MAG: hypothetical protein ACK4PN_12730 [Allorhizobium sp.]
MTTFNPNAATVYADGPSTAPTQPSKPLIRQLLTQYEAAIGAYATGAGSTAKPTRALLYSDLAHAAGDTAWVYADSTTAYDGIYIKSGASGSGSWSKILPLPYSFVVGTDTGAGTANAIQITTDIPVADGMIVAVTLHEAMTGSPVTFSINGGTPVTAMTPRDTLASALGEGQDVWFRVRTSDSTARMISDQDVAALVARAEAAAIEAADYAALARNDVVVNPLVGDGVTLDWPLTVDPGTANNMRVNISGVTQLRTSYSLVYVSSVPTLRMTEAVADGIPFEVEMGYRIAVGTPATGSVTYDKIQNVTSALRLLGRKSGSAGIVQEITPDELRDLFLPVGSVV